MTNLISPLPKFISLVTNTLGNGIELELYVVASVVPEILAFDKRHGRVGPCRVRPVGQPRLLVCL